MYVLKTVSLAKSFSIKYIKVCEQGKHMVYLFKHEIIHFKRGEQTFPCVKVNAVYWQAWERVGEQVWSAISNETSWCGFFQIWIFLPIFTPLSFGASDGEKTDIDERKQIAKTGK